MASLRGLLLLCSVAPAAAFTPAVRPTPIVSPLRAASSSSTPLPPSPTLPRLLAPRRVARLEKPLRLPVWPVLNGLALTALDLTGQKRWAAQVTLHLSACALAVLLSHVS